MRLSFRDVNPRPDSFFEPRAMGLIFYPLRSIISAKEYRMKITITKTEKPVPISLLHLSGTLDSANFETLIKEAQKLYTAGARDLILDMSMLTYISSAGLGEIHQVALLFRGKKRHEQDESWGDYRWAAYSKNDCGRRYPYEVHVKLFSPTKEVSDVLDMIGFNFLFEIYTDLHRAIDSFYRAVLVKEASLR
jgi:hypothetical protein